MYSNTPAPHPKKHYYFKDQQHRIYRSVFIGYHMDTGEQFAILREISNGRIWVIPKQRLYNGVIRNGQLVQEFQELHDFQDPYFNNAERTPELNYPGYTDDPRCFPRTSNRGPVR